MTKAITFLSAFLVLLAPAKASERLRSADISASQNFLATTQIPEANVAKSFMDEVAWAKSLINDLNEYKKKNWGIGLNGDSGQPDLFLSEFAARGLACSTFIVGAGLVIGGPEAYDENISVLRGYILQQKMNEVARVDFALSQIAEYKSNNWAIGLSYPDGQPDEFATFFASRKLPIAYYLMSGTQSVGSPEAYEKNMATLQGYLNKVKALKF